LPAVNPIVLLWNEERRTVKTNRTVLCDTTHDLIEAPGRLIIPRLCDEVKVFASQCVNIAKILQEDAETGAKVYRYRKLGEDHYRHALNYFYLAAQKIQVSSGYADKYLQQSTQAITDFDPFDYGDGHSVFDES